LAYIRRFISNLADHFHPFHHLMKKGAQFEWDQPHPKAFDSIKKYLSNPPVLKAPIPGKPLVLYNKFKKSLWEYYGPRKMMKAKKELCIT